MTKLSFGLLAGIALSVGVSGISDAQTTHRLQSVLRSMLSQNGPTGPLAMTLSDSMACLYANASSAEVQVQRHYRPTGPGGTGLTHENDVRYSYTSSGDTNAVEAIAVDPATGLVTRKYWELTHAYDASGQRTSTTTRQIISANTLQNSIRERYQVDANGLRVELVGENWNQASGTWENSYRTRFAYNAQGSLTLRTGAIWAASTWKETDTLRITYAANGTTPMLHEGWQNGAYGTVAMTEIRTLSTDPSGKILEFQHFNFSPSSPTFRPHTIFQYRYNAAGERDSAYQYEVDGSGNKTHGFVNVYDYAGPQNKISRDRLFVINPDGSRTFQQQHEYRYEAIAPVSVQGIPAFTAGSVYPVPARDLLNVSLSGDQNGSMAMRIMDMHGRTIRSVSAPVSSGQLAVGLNLEGIAAGTYMLHMTDANGLSSSAKFSVQR